MPPVVSQNLDLIFVLAGLAGLFLGGEALVRGAVSIAEKLRLPKLVVGVVIVGFGTSLPEMLVSLTAAQAGTPEIAIGNVVGSNIANILLILGVSALLSPISASLPGARRDAVAMVLASGALIALAFTGAITSQQGLMLLTALIVYMLGVIFFQKAGSIEAAPSKHFSSLFLSIMFVVGGLALLIGGADLLVRGATNVARTLGVSDAIIGLTLVAVGTSLPELTVSLISAVRRQTEVTLGNIVGSNIFNILGILGVTAALYPLTISPDFLRHDIPVMVAVALLLSFLIFRTGKIGRLSALLFLSLYATYMAWLFFGPSGVLFFLEEAVDSFGIG